MPGSKFALAGMTQSEVREAMERRPVVLIPIGSLEDQGPHVFMGDYLCAERIAGLIAERATERGTYSLVAPPVPFGCSDYFSASPGGIALSSTTFRAVLRDVFEALLRHEFKRLVVINGHGGNVQPVFEVGLEIHRSRGVLIPSLYIWKIAYGFMSGIIGEEATNASAGHGANPLGSVAMHLFPELVRPDLIPPVQQPLEFKGLKASNLGAVRFDGADIDLPIEYDAATSSGVVGGADPRYCSPETGALITNRLCDFGAKFVSYFAAHMAPT